MNYRFTISLQAIPAALEMRFHAELNQMESIQNAEQQLAKISQIKQVTTARQDAATMGNILQVKQYHFTQQCCCYVVISRP